jgi:transcriptional regulator with XRE-family HTH domain
MIIRGRADHGQGSRRVRTFQQPLGNDDRPGIARGRDYAASYRALPGRCPGAVGRVVGLYPVAGVLYPAGGACCPHHPEFARHTGGGAAYLRGVESDGRGRPDRRHFARLLKVFREARGLSRAELGALAGYSESTIKSFETGQRAVYEYHARHFDEAFGLDNVFVHEASRFGKAGYSAAYGAFIDVMAEADDLYWFEHSYVPGLFQTEQYARAILALHPDVSEELLNERLAARLAGQAILDGPSRRPRVWAVLDEAVLRRRLGDVAVMHEQLGKMAEVSCLRHVSIQVLPGVEAHIGLLGAFVIAERRGHPSIVHREATADGHVTDDHAIVEQTMLVFRSLQTRALPVDASRDLIARVDDEQWKAAARTGARALTAVPLEGNA